MRTPKIVKPIPAEELPAFLACVRYGRRLPGNEVFELVMTVWTDLLTNGHTMETHQQGEFPAFTLLEATRLPPSSQAAFWLRPSERAKITMLVRRSLPPYQSQQTYVIAQTVSAVMDAVPKDVKESTARARKPAPAVVGRRLLTE